MSRLAPVVLAALALAACKGPITEAECTDAAKDGKWDVTFTKSNGPDSCPQLEKTLSLPNTCESNCGCTEAVVVFEPSLNSAVDAKCSIRFHEVCAGYELDCRYVNVDGPAHASGDCFYKVGTDVCGYKVEWDKI